MGSKDCKLVGNSLGMGCMAVGKALDNMPLEGMVVGKDCKFVGSMERMDRSNDLSCS